ncbi:carboxypeptidase G2 [Legionella busanensis]|uniref:Carboxypeptidase G2 n=1 Tax=Legionella busanensis TaxID=190655 RepID=A0A378JSY4_9GAMM|nr:M20/M25/M40 family metallo-hydrolase [Legionella busanensis]STX51272.1 carboxypeptidase G2 [Legionella busanensis]
MKIRISIFLLLFLSQVFKVNALTQEENKIIHYLKASSQEQLHLLEDIVNTNSGTTNINGVKKVGEYLESELKQLGFTTQWKSLPAKMNRADTLIAYHQGNKGKRFLLIGHLDTVFPASSSFQRFNLKGNIATGPGVIDAKGGDVVIIYALKALAKVGALQDATITVVFTGDEEDSGRPTSLSRRPLIDAATHSDVALDFEWAISSDTATVARRGIEDWVIKTEGNEAHSSQIFKPDVGNGAIFELNRILDTLRMLLSKEQYLTFNPGLIMGGTTIEVNSDGSNLVFGKPNVIAKKAIAEGDIRFLTEQQKESAKKTILSILKQNLPGTTAEIIFKDGIPSMTPRKANLKLLTIYSNISSQLGLGKVTALDPGMRGAGDISYIAAKVPYALAGLGPVGSGAHSAKETLNVASLLTQTERIALLMYQLLNNPGLFDTK